MALKNKNGIYYQQCEVKYCRGKKVGNIGKDFDSSFWKDICKKHMDILEKNNWDLTPDFKFKNN